MIDTVIFDLDGTLLNTLDDLTDSVNYALSSLGYPVRTSDEVRMMVGNSVIYLIEQALPEGTEKEQFERCLAAFEEHYKTNMRNKTAPYGGVEQMLADVKSAGYKVAVVSNKPDVFTKKLVDELFGEYIPFAIGRSEDIPRKPAPDMVLYAMQRLGSDTSTTVYVGDSEVDVITSKNAGVPCIGCLWGFRDKATLEREGAEYLVSSPSELIETIK
ncbi:MAG: HAD family hydrolase, partial [Clostridia bacterium]|nr:HAD family hydrolase [Clostridia bacterium]